MRRLALTLLAVLFSSGCASVPQDQRVDYDPWEPANRSVYTVNDALDRAITKPIARGYTRVLPEVARKGVTNFSRNLFAPRSALNNFLQGKPKEGGGEILRFLMNSIMGVGGLFDVAAVAGLDEHAEDFGQTAAVWGIPPGPYVMLPFLGPQTLRDAMLLPFDIAADPLYHYRNSSVRDRLYVLRLINLRANLLSLDELLKDSTDPYVTVRESFLQNREFEVYDGNPPTEDDEFFDEFLEEDY